jgi:hypothetical protein
MYKILLISILFSVLITSCERSESDSDLIIKAGYACGWGAGEESLEISRSLIKYSFYIPAHPLQPEIIKTRAVSDNEWVELRNVINIGDFIKLDYNSCNICVDGCDEWISIQNFQDSHSIRFTKGLKIAEIDQLQKIIEQYRSEFRK